jgi:hypothetical protein
MQHLTMTGRWAGETYCGAPRAPDGNYCHANPAQLIDATQRASICPECLKIWDDAEDKS